VDGFASAAAPALRDRELVVFDQRGTGSSGVLRCPSVEGPFVRDPVAAGAECARRLGPARAFYTTRDSIEDVEAVRAALGVERISLLGVSYGTKVALGYAIAHPDHVDRLVLDSTVTPDGPDVFGRSGFAALPGALRDVCRARRCRGITSDPVADLARLAGRLRASPLDGRVVGPRGQRRRERLRTAGLLDLLFASDIDPTLLPALPAAVRSAGRGDTAPILRLARNARASVVTDNPHEFSSAVLVASLCEESAFPWTRTAPPAQRRQELAAALDALGDGPFAPFDRGVAAGLYAMPACYAWPAAPDPPAFPTAPLPAAPTLLVSGTRDLRTPLQDARGLAGLMPDARVLQVVGAGHSVLSSAEPGCPGRALGRFFAGRPVRTECPRDRGIDFEPDPIAPRSLGAVRPVHGPDLWRGRTVAAVLQTVADGIFSLLTPLSGALIDPLGVQQASAGGLRGGWVGVDEVGLVFHRAIYVPGVSVSGRLAVVSHGLGFQGRLSPRGPAGAHGTLSIGAAGLITGRLGGRPVRVRLSAGFAASGAPGSLARLRALRDRLVAAGARARIPTPPRSPRVGY
jgi:pimeloyl-ACP methyl ester carboxylesterase